MDNTDIIDEMPDIPKLLLFLKQSEPQLLQDLYRLEQDCVSLCTFKTWVQKTISDIDSTLFVNDEPLPEPKPKRKTHFITTTRQYTPEELCALFNKQDELNDISDEDIDDISDEDIDDILEEEAAEEEARITCSYYDLPSSIRDQITPEFINILHAFAAYTPSWFEEGSLDLLINWLTDIYEYHQFIKGN